MNTNIASNIDDPSPFILNEKNKWITSEFIENMLAKYKVNYKITNLEDFKKATIHTSYLIKSSEDFFNSKTKMSFTELDKIDDVKKAIQLQEESYERLEYLGDSIIHAILAIYFFNRYKNEAEGFMTKLRTKIENGETLYLLTKVIGLNNYVIISRYIEKMGGRENNLHILEDAFEAFMGALYLNAGFDVCRTFMINLMEEEVDFAQILFTETNFKDKLLRYFHQQRWLDPKYFQMDVSGQLHHKLYTVCVKCRKSTLDDGEIVGTGVASSKKKSEQIAAKNALIFFKVIGESDNVDADSDSEEYFEVTDITPQPNGIEKFDEYVIQLPKEKKVSLDKVKEEEIIELEDED